MKMTGKVLHKKAFDVIKHQKKSRKMISEIVGLQPHKHKQNPE